MPRVSVTLSRSGSHSDSGIPMYPQIGDWTQLIKLAMFRNLPPKWCHSVAAATQQHGRIQGLKTSSTRLLQAFYASPHPAAHAETRTTPRCKGGIIRFSKVVGKVFKSVGGYVRRFNRSLNDLIFQYFFNIYIYIFQCSVRFLTL